MSSISTIPLKIKFLTNFSDEKISFNKDLLHSNNKDYLAAINTIKKDIPFLCNNVLYDTTLFSDLEPQDMLTTLFDEDKLVSHINSNTTHEANDGSPVGIFISIKNPHCMCTSCTNGIIRNNVLITLRALFPVSFPTVNNIMDSLQIIRRLPGSDINETAETDLGHFFSSDTQSKLLTNYTDETKYSYIKTEDGQIYTFSRLIWLNDVLNHPYYSKLIKEYHIFYNWLVSKFVTKSLDQYDIIITKYSEKITDLFLDIYEKLFLPLSGIPANDITQKYNDAYLGKNFSAMFKNCFSSLLYVFHIILRINSDSKVDITSFKDIITDIFKTANDNIQIDEKIYAVIIDLIKEYTGKIYYINDEEKQEDTCNNQSFYASKNISELKNINYIYFEFNKKNQNLFPYNVDDIYNIVFDDEICRNSNRLANIKIFITHLKSLEEYILKPKQALGNSSTKNIPNVEPPYTKFKQSSNSNTDEINRLTNRKITFEQRKANNIQTISPDELNKIEEELNRLDKKIFALEEKEQTNNSEFQNDLKKLFSFSYDNSLPKIIIEFANRLETDIKLAKQNIKRQGSVSQLASQGEYIRYKNAFGDFDPKTGDKGFSSNKLLSDLVEKQYINQDYKNYSKHDNLTTIGTNCDHINDIFERIYKKFISGEQITDACKDILHLVMNTGISIKQDESFKKAATIFVMVDFLKGEITDQNIKKYKCKYYDQYLGMLVEDEMSGDDPITSDWKVTSSRLFIEKDDEDFSIESKYDINNPLDPNNQFDNDIEEEPTNDINQPNIPNNQPNIPNNQVRFNLADQNFKQSSSINNNVSNQLFEFIVGNDKIKTNLDEYNKYTRNPISENNLYDAVQTNPGISTVIKLWSDSDTKQDNDEFKKIWQTSNIRAISDLEKEIRIRDVNINNPGKLNPNDIARVKSEKRKYELFLTLTKELYKNGSNNLGVEIKSNNEEVKGGDNRKTKSNKKNKKTRKTRKQKR